MVDFLNELYGDALLITDLQELIESIRAEKYVDFREKWTALTEPLTEFCKRAETRETNSGSPVFVRLGKAVQCVNGAVCDMKAFADELTEIIPLMQTALESYGVIDVQEKNVRLFSSKAGFLSMQDVNKKVLYHSAIDPMLEAKSIAKRLYDPAKTRYFFLGCGLGYLPYYIYRLSDESADITIFHNHPSIVSYAKEYGVLDLIPENKLKVFCEANEEKLLKKFSSQREDENIEYYCMEDAINYLSPNGADKIRTFSIINATHTVYKDYLTVNTYRNLMNVKKDIYEYYPKSDNWIVVAAGPSLDAHLEHLIENKETHNVLCVGTVFKKLLNRGIRPDAVAIVDPQPRTWRQFEGIENENVPLFLNISGNWRFSEYYAGEKYLVPGLTIVDTKGRFKEEWITGGTVTSFAVEIAVKLGAKQIDLVGVDLAYPGEKTHAEGTMDNREISKEGMISVPCVSGGTVPTTEQFKTYIDDLSKKTNLYREVRFVNYSDGGAKIDNTVWYKKLQ